MYMTEITNLEKQIANLDREDSNRDDTMYRLTTSYHREGLDTKKRDLLTLLEQKLLAYSISPNFQFRQVFTLTQDFARYSSTPIQEDQNFASNIRKRSQEFIQMVLEETTSGFG